MSLSHPTASGIATKTMSNTTIVVNGVPIPNPFTPLALLPPDLAFQVQFGIYVLVGSLAAFLWDLITNLGNDYAILFKCSFTHTTVVYFLSRLSTLTYILSSVVYETSGIGLGKCRNLQKVPPAFFGIALMTTSLLFFFRIRAIYANNYFVIGFFALLWLSVAATGMAIPWAITGGNIGNVSTHCISLNLATYASGSIITSLIHDSLVFLAISYRLLHSFYYTEETLTTRVKGFMFGTSLPRFSKLVLQDGQLYYLVAVSMNLLSLIMLYVPNVATTYRTMFTVCTLAITNSAACYVFRKTKFGYIKDSKLATVTNEGATLPLTLLRRYYKGRDVATSATRVVVSTTTDIMLDNIPQNQESGQSSASLAAAKDNGAFDVHTHIVNTRQEYAVHLPRSGEHAPETSSLEK